MNIPVRGAAETAERRDLKCVCSELQFASAMCTPAPTLRGTAEFLLEEKPVKPAGPAGSLVKGADRLDYSRWDALDLGSDSD